MDGFIDPDTAALPNADQLTLVLPPHDHLSAALLLCAIAALIVLSFIPISKR